MKLLPPAKLLLVGYPFQTVWLEANLGGRNRKSIFPSFCSDKIILGLDKTEIVQDKIFVQGEKLYFLLSKDMQNQYLLLEIDFQLGNFVLNDFWKQKMYFLTLDKIFILDNFRFVQDKKYFVRAEGRGICLVLEN